jgi:excisionase family DNA binding protein
MNSDATRESAASGRKRGLPLAHERLAFRIREFAALIGVDRSTAYAIVRSGAIAYTRLPGGTLIVSRVAIDDYLNRSLT